MARFSRAKVTPFAGVSDKALGALAEIADGDFSQ
jgi:hypothetical protein